MPRQRRLVVPPAPLRALWSHRLLRLVAEPARKRSCQSERPPSHTKFRARRGLVLRLRNRRRHGRSSVSAARAPSAQAADARPCRQGATRLGAPPPLSDAFGVPQTSTGNPPVFRCRAQVACLRTTRSRPPRAGCQIRLVTARSSVWRSASRCSRPRATETTLEIGWSRCPSRRVVLELIMLSPRSRPFGEVSTPAMAALLFSGMAS